MVSCKQSSSLVLHISCVTSPLAHYPATPCRHWYVAVCIIAAAAEWMVQLQELGSPAEGCQAALSAAMRQIKKAVMPICHKFINLLLSESCLIPSVLYVPAQQQHNIALCMVKGFGPDCRCQ